MSGREDTSQTTSRQPALWRRVLLRRDVVTICLFIFLSDMIVGMIAPTLSLFAQGLGASLTLIGVLTAILGLARLFGSVGIGALSDRRGRKTILILGSLTFCAASLLYALAPSPVFLIPTQVLLGLAFVSTLTISLAYASDAVTSGPERSLALGLATTSMGLGYAIGSYAGGNISSILGYRANYLTTMMIAAVAFVIAWRLVPRDRHHTTRGVGPQFAFREQMRVLMADPVVLAIAVGGLLNNFVFGGLVITFFPIYANGLGVSQAGIGTMFGMRALASTVARLPAGALGAFVPGHRILLGAISLSMLVAFSIPQNVRPMLLLLLLIVEGIAYGTFMTVGQATIAGRASDGSRGAALGVYMAAASVGDSVLPLVLGAVADAFGIRSVFYIGGTFVILGLVIITRIFVQHPLRLQRA